ncbi:MAG: FmdB family zinc ribbon protein [Lentisphaerota bacterium]
MPTYEYKCVNCDYRFELFQSMTAAPIGDCPKCCKNTLKRLIGTGSGIIFKGSGFYQTDYRSSSYQAGAKSDLSSSSSSPSAVSTTKPSAPAPSTPISEKKSTETKTT